MFIQQQIHASRQQLSWAVINAIRIKVYFEIYKSIFLQEHKILAILSEKISLDEAQKIKIIKAKILVGHSWLNLNNNSPNLV